MNPQLTSMYHSQHQQAVASNLKHGGNNRSGTSTSCGQEGEFYNRNYAGTDNNILIKIHIPPIDTLIFPDV